VLRRDLHVLFLTAGAAVYRLNGLSVGEDERTCWHPKDGELWPGQAKTEETMGRVEGV